MKFAAIKEINIFINLLNLINPKDMYTIRKETANLKISPRKNFIGGKKIAKEAIAPTKATQNNLRRLDSIFISFVHDKRR